MDRGPKRITMYTVSPKTLSVLVWTEGLNASQCIRFRQKRSASYCGQRARLSVDRGPKRVKIYAVSNESALLRTGPHNDKFGINAVPDVSHADRLPLMRI